MISRCSRAAQAQGSRQVALWEPLHLLGCLLCKFSVLFQRAASRIPALRGTPAPSLATAWLLPSSSTQVDSIYRQPKAPWRGVSPNSQPQAAFTLALQTGPAQSKPDRAQCSPPGRAPPCPGPFSESKWVPASLPPLLFLGQFFSSFV